MKTPTLETERLILRPISLDDAPVIQKYFNNWNIVKWTTGPWPYPENGAEEYLRIKILPANEEGRWLSWAITLKSSHEFIGRIDYCPEDETNRGFWLAEPFQKMGYMGEAIVVTQDYMFFEYGLDVIKTKNTISNIASSKLKENYGGVLVGIEEKPCAHLQEPTEIWEITRENWAKIRGKEIEK